MELPAPGQIFQRKYKLQEILGRGGFAAVFRATDIEIGRDVAIKVLAPGDDGYSTGIASRFMREARVIGAFQDPHTITMFEFGRSDDGLLFMVFEYVKGKDLSGVIKSRGPLPQQDVIHILKQVLQSLREAHAADVMHRDIKPANILVYDYMGDANRVKLLDFGIAKAVAGDEAGINLTREGAMIGTPRYMSPEQIYGADLGPQSDLYSLGLVAHEMLVGKPAITGTTSKEMLRAQLADDPVRLPRDRVLATENFCGIIDRMTARDPGQRFEDAAAVMQALEWVEHADGDAPMQRSGALLGMEVSGISPAYATPRESSRSDEFASRSGERSWERSGPIPGQGPPQGHPSGPYPQPPGPYGQPPGPYGPPPGPHQSGPYNTPPHSGGHPAYGSGAYPARHSGGHPAPPPYDYDRSGQVPNQGPDDSVPPSTERPRTLEEEGEGDISMGTILGAGLGAAALVVGLLMLMSFLGQRGSDPPPVDAVETADVATPTQDAAAAAAPAAPAAAADAVAPVSARSGCGDKAPWTAETELTASERAWLAYLPVNYDPKKPYPLTVVFHDKGQDGRGVLIDTQLKRLADKHGFVVVAPDAANIKKGFAKDESTFVAQVLDETAAVACVDRSRVFAVGHGDGARAARQVACKIPFSAIALTGDGLATDETLCAPDEPSPTIRMHGTLDRYVPARGGEGCRGGKYQPNDDAEAAWRVRNGCEGKAREASKSGKNVCQTWDCAQPFVSCRLNGGHSWPGARADNLAGPGCFSEPPKFPMGEEIWTFFQRHGKTLGTAQ